MRAIRKSKRRFDNKLRKIADSLLKYPGYDITALANHPVSSLLGKPVVSGARIRYYLDNQQGSGSLGRAPRMDNEQDRPPRIETSDAEGNPDDMTRADSEDDQTPVKWYKDWPQFASLEHQRERAIHRFPHLFPTSKETFERLPGRDREELLWTLGANTFEQIIERHPDFLNVPILPSTGEGSTASGRRGKPTTSSTPLAGQVVPKTPTGPHGLGLSTIRHSDTYTHAGSSVRIRDRPDNPNSSSGTSMSWDPQADLNHPNLQPPPERPINESNYVAMGQPYKSTFAQRLVNTSRYGSVTEPLDSAVNSALVGIPRISEEARENALLYIEQVEKYSRRLVLQLNGSHTVEDQDLQNARRLIPSTGRRLRDLEQGIQGDSSAVYEIGELRHALTNLQDAVEYADNVRRAAARAGSTPVTHGAAGGAPPPGDEPSSDESSDDEQPDRRPDAGNGGGGHGGGGHGGRGPGGGGNGGGGHGGGGRGGGDPPQRNHDYEIALLLDSIARSQRRQNTNAALLAARLEQMPTHQRATDGFSYQNALKTLLFFSGREANDHRNIPSAAKNNIEPDCDRWIANLRRCWESFNMDEASRLNSFYDRLCGDALELLLDFRVTDHTMDQRLARLRTRYAGIRTLTQINVELSSFARRPGENLNVAVSRLERLGAEYLAGSSECTVETKDLLIWNAFLTLVRNPQLTEKFEALRYTSRDLQEAIRLAQMHYDRFNLSPWSKKHLEKEQSEQRSKKSHSISANKLKCPRCGGNHRVADCLAHGDNLQNIKSGPSTSGYKNGKKSGKPDDKSKKKCYWCNGGAHGSRECPVFEKIQNWHKRKSEHNRKDGGRKRKSTNSHRVNNTSAEPQAESPEGEVPDATSDFEDPENC